ncbi:MAG: EAL domain-containing protein [Methylococcales bacterium]|nr:EAL domain-containing protein [Methylococcales bacterium]
MIENKQKPVVLIAEDDLITQMITSNALKEYGFDSIVANNGQQAIELCQQELPQLILMDASMPVLNGFEVCQKIKQSSDKTIREIPIIMVTSQEENDAIDQAFSAGAEDYIAKPVNWHILKHRMDLLLRRIQAEKALRESEQRFHAIASSAKDAIITTNTSGNIVYWNRAAARVFGYLKTEILNQPFVTLIPDDNQEQFFRRLMQANQTDIPLLDKNIHQFKAVNKAGGIFPIELTFSAWVADNQRFYSCILRDISKRVKNQEEINKLSMAVKQSPNLMMITNIAGVIEYATPQVKKITGYEPSEIIGKNINHFRSAITDPTIYQSLWQTIEAGSVWHGTLQNEKKDGSPYWLKISISSITDNIGEIAHFISILEDVTKHKALSDEMAFRASHDPLTGLINRYEFELHLNLLLRNSTDTDTHTLCFMDLDRFKIVNDTAGHLAGDELLRQLTKVMKTVGRKQDILARLGGDEFALILSYCKPQQALQIAEKLLATINDFQLVWDGISLQVGASIGIVNVKKGDSAVDVVQFADTACYAAKNTGRNKVYQFNENDNIINTHAGEMKWVAKIEEALRENRFRLYVQRIVGLSNNEEKSKYEVLLRLIDAEDNIILPDVFLPAAERFSLATKIDYWVIEHSLNWFITHPDTLNALDSFSINLSGQSLGNEKLQAFIINLIEDLNFPPDKLIFEITETAAINNLQQAKTLIVNLQQIGVRFSLDDFGSGLSSFAYLKNLPVEFLKIDGMFVKDIESNPIDRAMVTAINEVGQVMDKQTIAEFVENQEIVDVLKSIGVDYAQGYHYCRPIPIDSI